MQDKRSISSLIIATLLIVVLSLVGCVKEKQKVISNREPQLGQVNVAEQRPENKTDYNTPEFNTEKSGAEESIKINKDYKGIESKGKSEKSNNIEDSKDSKDNKDEGSDTKEKELSEESLDNKNNDDSNDGKDEEVYGDYQGPVQGEIKYQEGRPAGENSKEYKASGDIESPYKVDLIVTTDYGHNKIFAKNVGLVKDEVGMEVLFRNLDIQTAYGGGFVNAINGIESQYTFFTGKNRKKVDWFYWVNGILAPIGIAEYKPQPGDVIWWDHHNWSTTMFVPAVIGAYPQPFKNGFWGKNPGTMIMYCEEWQAEAEKLKASLLEQGVKQIDVIPYNPELVKKPSKYCILLGPWEELRKDNEMLQDINMKNKLLGVYVKFAEGKVAGLNYKGKAIVTYDNAGAIYSFTAHQGGIKPIWLITGSNKEGTHKAWELLMNKPETIDKYFGVVVTEKEVLNVPFVN